MAFPTGNHTNFMPLPGSPKIECSTLLAHPAQGPPLMKKGYDNHELNLLKEAGRD
jgi:hypothetical protein